MLLLDEPFSNLDYASRKQVETLLNRIHEKNNITILIVSHDLNFVPSRCKRIIVLEHGKIIMDGSREKILKSEIINSIFNGNGGKI